MKVSRPEPNLLILEHDPRRTLVFPAAFLTLLVVLGFRDGIATGVAYLAAGAVLVLLHLRDFEQVRAVFDRTAGPVDIRRRADLWNVHRARYDLGGSASVDVRETERRGSARFQLVRAVRNGRDAGHDPLHLVALDQHDLPEIALDITYWLKTNP